jgi:DNA-binding transcriptional MerR regulator
MNKTPEDILTIGDVAREFDRCVETLREWDRSGKFPAMRTPMGIRIYRRADVDRLKAELRELDGERFARSIAQEAMNPHA